MDFIKKIFGCFCSSSIEDLRKSLVELQSLKRDVLSTTIEYKRLQKEWEPCKELIAKGQAFGSLVTLDKKYDQSIKRLEKGIAELGDRQEELRKGIISQVVKNPILFSLLFVDDFMPETRYNELVCSLVKGHKEGKINDSQLKKLTTYKKKNLTDEEKVYVKDNRTQYADTIIVDDENRILFTIRNKMDDFCPSCYCLPGGHIEDGETPREAAQRELNEETGISLELYEFNPCGEYIDNKSHIYYFCVHSNIEPVVLDEREQQQWEKVGFDEIDQKPLIMNLKDNLKQLIAIPKKVLNKDADNAQKIYFDGKGFKKGKEFIPNVFGLKDCGVLIKNNGECGVYLLEKGIYVNNPINRKLGRVGASYGGQSEETKFDREGNPIGFGEKHITYDVKDFGNKYPQISSDVDKSVTTESVYVTYRNKDNGKSVKVRFSNHESNAVKFGDVLNGKVASEDEILFHLGLKDREFVPITKLVIPGRFVSKKNLDNYEIAPLTMKDIFELGKDADLTQYAGMVAKDSNYLIEGGKVQERPDGNRGTYRYFDIK